MSSKIDCPDRETLANLLLGKVPAGRAELLEEHLLDCAICAGVAESVHPADDVTEAFSGKEHLEDDASLTDAMDRAKRLRAGSETLQSEETLQVDPKRHVAPSADASPLPEEVDFLAPAEEPDEIGRLGDYRVLEVMGVGGMGVVFRAEDPKLERQVALKAMKPAIAASKSAKDRFLREAKATAAIEHDNIVQIYQVGEDRSIPFIAMRYLRGESLQAKLDRVGQLDQRKVVHIGRQVAAGLKAAHKKGLIHRDIKPDNIWLEEETNRAKILDFGLARSHEDDDGLTQTGMVLGTPKYMAPEQAKGETVDHRCDLFSLGSVLYHLASGRAPFGGGNLTATLIAVSQADCRPIEEVAGDLDSSLAKLIMRLLSKDRDARPQSAAEVVDALAKFEKQMDQRLAEQAKQQQLAETAQFPATASPRPRGVGRSEVTSPTTSQRKQVGSSATRLTRSRVVFVGVVAVALLLFVTLWATGVIFKVETPHGTLVVEVEGDNFETKLKGKTLTIKDTFRDETYEITLDGKQISEALKEGEYEFVLRTGSGLEVSTKRFEIKGDEDSKVVVSWEPSKAVATANAAPETIRRIASGYEIERTDEHGWPADAPPPAIAPFNAEQARKHQEAWAKYLGVSVEKEVKITDDTSLTLVLIPPGEFMMGSTEEEVAELLKQAEAVNDRIAIDRIPSEAPLHPVRISQPFYIGKYEVTQGQWQAVMGENPAHFKGASSLPVEQVSWNDVQPFLAKLQDALEEEELKFALPSEAQWEFGCRAGTATSWHFGNHDSDLKQYGWFGEKKTRPVGQLKQNAFGLFDVYGNVFEWCTDWWSADYYEHAPVNDPICRTEAAHHVLRGGGWYHEAMKCRSAYRHFYSVDNSDKFLGHLGVRVVAKIDRFSPKPSAAIAPLNADEASQRQEAWAKYLGVPVVKEVVLGRGDEGKDVQISMVLIPPGEFLMGSSDEERENLLAQANAANDSFSANLIPTEGPQHPVRITRPFYLASCELTQEQWAVVMGDNPANNNESLSHPVENVSWDDVQSFLEKLNDDAPDGAKFLLPTEAQWEYACRAGTTAYWHFDNKAELPKCAWFNTSSGGTTHPVGELTPNAFGLFDMHGNVGEWCADRLRTYQQADTAADDPSGGLRGPEQVFRGGGYSRNAATCRSAYRARARTDDQRDSVGVRLAMVVEPDSKPATAIGGQTKADYDAIAIGNWVRPFNVKPPQKQEGVEFEDGILKLTDYKLALPQFHGRDFIVRAKIRPTATGQSFAVRCDFAKSSATPGGRSYGGWINFNYRYGIGFAGDGWRDFTTELPEDPPVTMDGYIDLAFSAIGTELTLYVNGKRVAQVTDDQLTEGYLGLGARDGTAWFRDVEVMALDD